MTKPIILASGSKTRRQLLRRAGVTLTVEVPRIDEGAIMATLVADNAKPRDIANTLAEYKAKRISSKFQDGIVIAADQILVCEGEVYSKANDLEAARNQLLKLRSKGHQLLSAVVIHEDGAPVWRQIGRAQLVMRDFSNDFLDSYIEEIGEDLLTSVGCYKLENRGVQLFSSIQGDYFTILGLPLVEVLSFLRSRGVLIE